jgi:plastocyanin
MIARLIVALTLVASALLVSSSASAGGWATVRTVDDPVPPVVGQPWIASLLVKQHDKTERDVDELSVHFVHQESGSTMDATGVSTGEIGHYRIEVLFKEAGLWNWTATPAPFGPTNLASLEVLETAAAVDLGGPSATFVVGTCAAPGEEIERISLEQSDAIDDQSLTTAIIPSLGELTDRFGSDPIAVIIGDPSSKTTRLACGELPAAGLTAPTMVTLASDNGSNTIGTISLVPNGEDAVATLTVLSPPASTGVTIRINNMEGGTFDPGSISIPVGTKVTWVNDSTMAHTITGSSDGFRNSGMLDPGASFSQTFDKAGTYSYVCDPHQWMTGTITVVA